MLVAREHRSSAPAFRRPANVISSPAPRTSQRRIIHSPAPAQPHPLICPGWTRRRAISQPSRSAPRTSFATPPCRCWASRRILQAVAKLSILILANDLWLSMVYTARLLASSLLGASQSASLCGCQNLFSLCGPLSLAG